MTKTSGFVMPGVAERLVYVRRVLGMTQVEAANCVEVSANTWRRWEQHNELPSSKVAARLIENGFDANWLLTGRGEMLALSPASSGRDLADSDEISPGNLTEAQSDFAARLRAVRLRLGLSQRAMAERVGVDEKTWQRSELGKSAPRAETLRQLIRLGFDANWIIDGIGEMRIGDRTDHSARIDHVVVQSKSPGLTESDLRKVGIVYGIGPFAPACPPSKTSRLLGFVLSLMRFREVRT